MTSEGQAWALAQIREICDKAAGALEVVEIVPPATEGEALVVELSVYCSSSLHKPGGIPFRTRERLRVSIPPRFPFKRPELDFTHERYAGYPHVQWGSHICLYQAPDSEWNPEDGMFGFVQRLDDWLQSAAAGELDPTGLPLHPPVVYPSAAILVVPRVDTPVASPPWWAGYARITREEERWIELGGWLDIGSKIPDVRVAPAILLPDGMPFEYPVTMAGLKNALAQRGIPLEIVRLLMTIGALRNEAGKPLYFMLGAAMRGISGGEQKQHLACWLVDASRSDELRAAALQASGDNPIDQQLFESWAETATISWCRISEDRPEIIVRRDIYTPMSLWRGRHVAILGCGAIGSAAAMLLGRAGVARMQVYDKGLVTPGILVRQLFDRQQIGETKAKATRFNVRYANPDVEVIARQGDIITALDRAEDFSALMGADIIIDATASRTVALDLERRYRDPSGAYPPIMTFVIGRNADCGMVTCRSPIWAGAAIDLDRRTKLALAEDPCGTSVLDEFWPLNLGRTRFFQPEPGCSDPTFRGSAADVLGLTSAMLNVASPWLRDTSRSGSFVMRSPTALKGSTAGQLLEYAWPSDRILNDVRHGYQIRIDPAAEKSLLDWIRVSERKRGPRVETGGGLFGEINELLKIIWVNEITGPPRDSVASRSGFECGTHGLASIDADRNSRTRGSVQFIGMWHTHPGGRPDPSPKDLRAIDKLFDGSNFKGRTFLMLIIGGNANAPDVVGSLFDRSDRDQHGTQAW